MQQNTLFRRRATLANTTLALALTFTLGHTPQAHAAAWDACVNALGSNQLALAVTEANALLKQKSLPKETAYFANLCLGHAWYEQGEFKKALPPLQEAARLATNPEQRYAAQSWLGGTISGMGDLEQASAAHRLELEAAVQLGDASKEASALNNLAIIAKKREQYDEALRLYTQSLAKQTDTQAKATVLNNIASVHTAQGRYALAVDALQQAIAINRATGNQKVLAMRLLNLGDTYRHLKQWQDVNQTLTEGLRLARAVGDRYWEGVGLAYFGSAFRDSGDPVQAREHFNQALRLFQEIGAKGEVAGVTVSLSSLEK